MTRIEYRDTVTPDDLLGEIERALWEAVPSLSSNETKQAAPQLLANLERRRLLRQPGEREVLDALRAQSAALAELDAAVDRMDDPYWAYQRVLEANAAVKTAIDAWLASAAPDEPEGGEQHGE